MICDRCQAAIPSGEQTQHNGQMLCEDCYMDVLSPARACDPWAVHSAKRFEESAGKPSQLNKNQENILHVLEATGGVELPELSRRTGLKPADLEREIAALRHMEKLRAEMRADRKVLCLW
jgi:hypothetical protein